MARWLTRACARVRTLAASGDVRFSDKASHEIEELGLHLDWTDAAAIVATLSPKDFSQRFRDRDSKEWLYVFTPIVGGRLLYVKLALRTQCVVVSFHEAEDKEPRA